MIEAANPTHEALLVAGITGLALVVAATIPMLWANFRGVRRMGRHMPTNGETLTEMIERGNTATEQVRQQASAARVAAEDATRQAVAARMSVVNLAARFDEHVEEADAYRAEVEPLVEFVTHLMGEEREGT